MKRIAILIFAALPLLAACQRPAPPSQDKPPEPRAASETGDGGN